MCDIPDVTAYYHLLERVGIRSPYTYGPVAGFGRLLFAPGPQTNSGDLLLGLIVPSSWRNKFLFLSRSGSGRISDDANANGTGEAGTQSSALAAHDVAIFLDADELGEAVAEKWGVAANGSALSDWDR